MLPPSLFPPLLVIYANKRVSFSYDQGVWVALLGPLASQVLPLLLFFCHFFLVRVQFVLGNVFNFSIFHLSVLIPNIFLISCMYTISLSIPISGGPFLLLQMHRYRLTIQDCMQFISFSYQGRTAQSKRWPLSTQVCFICASLRFGSLLFSYCPRILVHNIPALLILFLRLVCAPASN